MKYIQQISTGKAVHREEPHTDKTLQNASIEHKIPVSDLVEVDDATTELEWITKCEDAKPWEEKIRDTDSTCPRWFEDFVQENSIVLAPGRVKDNYDAKVALRNTKP